MKSRAPVSVKAWLMTYRGKTPAVGRSLFVSGSVAASVPDGDTDVPRLIWDPVINPAQLQGLIDTPDWQVNKNSLHTKLCRLNVGAAYDAVPTLITTLKLIFGLRMVTATTLYRFDLVTVCVGFFLATHVYCFVSARSSRYYLRGLNLGIFLNGSPAKR